MRDLTPKDVRLLYVDDDDKVLSLIAAYFDQNHPDIEVVTEQAVSSALKRLEDERIDCVVSDYRMPGMDGLEFLEAVRRDYANLPFILFTGKGTESAAIEAVRGGATDYVRKSAGTEQYELLANRVRNAVERRRTRVTYRNVFDAVNDAVLVLDVETGAVVEANAAARDMWGYADREFRELDADDLQTCATEDNYVSFVDRVKEETAGDSSVVDCRCVDADGDQFRVEVSVRRTTIEGQERILAVARDVTRRRRREAALDTLLSTTRGLLTTSSPDRIFETAVRSASDLLGADLGRAYSFDAPDGSAAPRAATDAARAVLGEEHAPPPTDDRHQPASASHHTAIAQGDEAPDGVASELRIELGNYGALHLGTRQHRAFGEYERDLAQILAAHLEAALDRADQEQLLRERKRRLVAQRDRLETLNLVNEVIRNVNRALVHVSTRDEIERLVCEQFAGAEPYRLAWIGKYDLARKVIEPRAWAGIENGYVAGRTIRADDAADNGAIAEAVRRRDVTIVSDVRGGTLPEERADIASSHGYRSIAYVPIVYQNVFYGMLAIYADTEDAFDEDVRTVLDELGGTIGYAINAAQRRSSQIDGSAVELELAADDERSPIVALSKAVGCTVELETCSHRSDGVLDLFVNVSDATAATVRSWAATQPTVMSVDDLTHDRETVVSRIVTQQFPLFEYVAEQGATIRAARAESGDGYVSVEMSANGNVRQFVESFESNFDGGRLIARGDVNDRPRDAGDRWSALTERLTDRQQEVLQVAYHSGFFESPRDRNGTEIAELLGISAPTFHDHLRAGQRKLLTELLSESS